MAVDRGIGLGGFEAVGPGAVGKLVEPGVFAEDAGLHGIGHVGEDAGGDAGSVEALRPLGHGEVEVGPEVGVGVDEGGEVVLGEQGKAGFGGNELPVGVPGEDAAIVGVAVRPVAAVEGVFRKGGNGAHAGPGFGVGGAGEDEPVVEEDGADGGSKLVGDWVGELIGVHRGCPRLYGCGWGCRLASVCEHRSMSMGHGSWRFSARTAWDVGESTFAAAIRRAREAGERLVDLTISNPTVCGFAYDADEVLGPLRQTEALGYEPHPRGMQVAREAVRGYYAEHGAAVDADEIVLTTSTSEAYSFVFRLLCDAGDEVLIARPSYPLFDFLAELDNVRLRSYPLFYDHGWWIDFAELERAIGPRTKAIAVVHPNNPTGHATSWAERERMEEICVRRGLALIVDEVFLDYPLREGESIRSFAEGEHPAPTFVLSGMSKIAGLPQMKAAWVVVCGPAAEKAEALVRMEVVADTFLSMSAPVQLALPFWLARRGGMREQILGRLRANVEATLRGGVEMLRADAGWSAVLRLPQRSGDAVEFELLRRGVVVHPGEFYGMGEGGRAVVSLIVPVDEFRMGMEMVRGYGAE